MRAETALLLVCEYGLDGATVQELIRAQIRILLRAGRNYNIVWY